MKQPPAVRIVLVETSHGGNIGATARAMKNMCQHELVLVNPKRFLSEEAIARASGAEDVLQKALCCSSLAEAVADCHWVVGTSARLRSVKWPQMNPRECAEQIRKYAHQRTDFKAALVFGRERNGLTNDELDHCHALVHIPANPKYSSLNLGMAVQILCYELMMLDMPDNNNSLSSSRETVDAKAMYGLFSHLEQTLEDIGFMDPRKSDKLMRRLKRIFYRARLDADELKIIRGILSAAQGRKSARRS